MGEVCRYSCECGWEKALFPGSGRNSRSMQVIKRTVPPEIYDEWLTGEKEGVLPEAYLWNRIIYCSKCRDINTVCEFVYGEKKYTLPCPVCGEEGEGTGDNGNIPCPVCGKAMTYTVSGHWD